MIPAYDESYVSAAQVALGTMLDYAVYDLKYEMDAFFRLFISSGIAARFEDGDCGLLAGRSGVEIAWEVLSLSGSAPDPVPARPTSNRSEEYWTGWALAYYQWYSALPFEDIVQITPVREVRAMYSPYHEMDIRQFCDEMDRIRKSRLRDTNLKRRRLQLGLSQQDLADFSGVPVRTIQQYEQRQKDINRASVSTVTALSRALFCSIDTVLE